MTSSPIEMQQKFNGFHASEGGNNVAGNYSSVNVCGTRIRKRYFWWTILTIVFISLAAILVPVCIVKFTNLDSQDTQNNPSSASSSDTTVEDTKDASSSSSLYTSRESSSENSELDGSSTTFSTSRTFPQSRTTSSIEVFTTSDALISPSPSPSPSPSTSSQRTTQLTTSNVGQVIASSSPPSTTDAFLPASATQPCWDYPTDCPGVQYPGNPCHRNEDCCSPYPCIADGGGGGSSVCASYGLMSDGSTTSICPG